MEWVLFLCKYNSIICFGFQVVIFDDYTFKMYFKDSIHYTILVDCQLNYKVDLLDI